MSNGIDTSDKFEAVGVNPARKYAFREMCKDLGLNEGEVLNDLFKRAVNENLGPTSYDLYEICYESEVGPQS